MNGRLLERILLQVPQLTASERARLIQRVAETLIPAQEPVERRQMAFGQFAGENLSTEEDFILAEWRPTEKDLNGT